jgi:hypothetical protein
MAVYTASQTLNYLSERSGLYTVVTEGPDGLGEEGSFLQHTHFLKADLPASIVARARSSPNVTEHGHKKSHLPHLQRLHHPIPKQSNA